MSIKDLFWLQVLFQRFIHTYEERSTREIDHFHASLCREDMTLEKGIGVHVFPPSAVLSRNGEVLLCLPIAQPVVLETKLRSVICLKFAPGDSFAQCCPPSLVL